MPTKTKPKPKAKRRPPVPMSASLNPAVLEGVTPTESYKTIKPGEIALSLKHWIHIFEETSGAKAHQTRVSDFIRWWEEREKSS